MLVKTDRGPDGNAKAAGTQSLLMTDFGIKPPVFMLGTLRTGNKIKYFNGYVLSVALVETSQRSTR